MVLWRGFQKPKRLATDTETLTDKYGRFYAQPFERGFGTTIGNALRRVLLSAIEGEAVTAVKIEGVLHEFQSIRPCAKSTTRWRPRAWARSPTTTNSTLKSGPMAPLPRPIPWDSPPSCSKTT